MYLHFRYTGLLLCAKCIFGIFVGISWLKDKNECAQSSSAWKKYFKIQSFNLVQKVDLILLRISKFFENYGNVKNS